MSQLSTVSIVSSSDKARIYTNVASIDASGEYLSIHITPPKGSVVIHNIPHRYVEYFSIKPQKG